MHPLKATKALEPVGLQECATEAAALRAYCESRFLIGPSSGGRFAATGEEHAELWVSCSQGFNTPKDARIAAQEHFDRYAKSKSGTLYWRMTPEIAYGPKQRLFAYYLRLLISDKPQIKKAS